MDAQPPGTETFTKPGLTCAGAAGRARRRRATRCGAVAWLVSVEAAPIDALGSGSTVGVGVGAGLGIGLGVGIALGVVATGAGCAATARTALATCATGTASGGLNPAYNPPP